MQVEAVFFDFGGVIVASPFEAFRVYEQRRGLPPDAVRTVNSTRPDDNAWARLERGEIDLDRFVVDFEAEALSLGYELDGAEVIACLETSVRPPMVAAVRACHDRLVTALLTNNPAAMDPVAHPELAEVLSMFDYVTESSVLGFRKPEPRFYEHACRLAGVDPEAVVFLDDLGVNLKPAAAMGMTTIKVVDPATALAELEDIVGFPLR
ncbi:MAG: HAD-IA family hydrolase [Microthrixaceae bacterium]